MTESDFALINDERAALGRIVLAFQGYRQDAEAEVARWEQNHLRLPPHHRALLANQLQKFAAVRQAIYTNHFFIASLLEAYDEDEAGTDAEQEADSPAGTTAIQPTSAQTGLQQQAQCDSNTDPAVASAGDASPPPQLPDTAGATAPGQDHSPCMLSAANAAAAAAAASGHLPSAMDMDKVRYVLKNLARDWSTEGIAERQQSYGRIVTELQARLGSRPPAAPAPRVLVPGTGLARLCCEVASLGYAAEGNEFSYFMLLTSSFILNHMLHPCQYTIYPWCHSNCNNWSDADQLRGVAIPDVHPAQLVAGEGLLSMCAGDFVECYGKPDMAGAFDAVVTCFFMDTAHNVVQYMEVIHNCLKPGGYWIDLGPLLYHWAEQPGEQSVELSMEELQKVALALGFRCLAQERVQAAYIANWRSMYHTQYDASFRTMVKE